MSTVTSGLLPKPLPLMMICLPAISTVTLPILGLTAVALLISSDPPEDTGRSDSSSHDITVSSTVSPSALSSFAAASAAAPVTNGAAIDVPL